MSLGKNAITIDSDELIKGMTTSSNLLDGGFSPESDAINMVANPGVLYPPNAAVDITGGLTSSARIMASTYDNVKSNTLNISKWLIDTAGQVYYIDSAGALHNPTSFSSTYIYGQTYMIPFLTSGTGALIFVTSTIDIGLLTVNDTTPGSSSTNANWWTSTKSQSALQGNVPHPMIVFNKTLFIADGNLLHTWDGTTATSAVLTLLDTEVITSMNIDPSTGRLILGIASRGQISATTDFAQQIYSTYFVGLYDGVNPTQLLRKIPVDSAVTAIKNVGGKLYMAYGGNIGIWNGNGIDFVRKFYSNQLGSLYTMTTNHMTNIGNLLFYIDNNDKANNFKSNTSFAVDMIGEIQPGIVTKNHFLSSNNGFSFIDNLWAGSGNNVGFIYSQNISGTEKVYYVPLFVKSTIFSTGDNSPIFVSKRVAFPRPSVLNQVRIFFEDQVAANGNVIGNLSVIDDKLNVVYNKDISNPSGGSATTWFDIFPDCNTTQVQIKYWWKETATSHGVQKIMLFYTPYE